MRVSCREAHLLISLALRFRLSMLKSPTPVGCERRIPSRPRADANCAITRRKGTQGKSREKIKKPARWRAESISGDMEETR
jgi:hypothetical protein